MAEILVKAVDATNPDATLDRQGCYKRGDPVLVKDDGHTWGALETLPTFVRINVSDATAAEVEQYMKQWQLSYSLAVISQDLVLDQFRLRITANDFNTTSNEGKVTRNQIESYLNGWGAAVVTVADNAVTFDIAILDALKSSRFWSQQIVDRITISEQSYTQITGQHRLSINYSTLLVTLVGQGNTAAQARARILQEVTKRKGALISNSNQTNTAVIDFGRDDVHDRFNADVAQRKTAIARRMFRFDSATMDAAELAGGVLVMTKLQAIAGLQDRREVVI